MNQIFTDNTINKIENGLRELLPQWGFAPPFEIKFLTVSENITFYVAGINKNAVCRIHRPDYHTLAEIKSELQWIEDLRKHNIIKTPAPLKNNNGEYFGTLNVGGVDRTVALFEFIQGTEPSPNDPLEGGFKNLGEITAKLHLHSIDWVIPQNFVRKVWDFDATLGKTKLWGDWKNAKGLDENGINIIGQSCDKIKSKLIEYKQTTQNFGLIHADLRLANLLVDGDNLAVIDFDDCGFSWFMYDFAAAISFFEESLEIPKLKTAWLNGYKSIRELSNADEDMIDTFIMLRRILLTAWLASHPETPTAKELDNEYGKTTIKLAEDYLSDLGK